MVRRWSGYYKNRILNLLPLDGSKIRSKDIHSKARQMGIGPNTVQNYLNMLVGEGSVTAIAERPKEVYYSRCEDVRIKHLIDDFMQEIDNTLSELPLELRIVERKLEKGSLTETEGKKAVEILSHDQTYLKGLIVNTLYHKVCEMVKANLPDNMKGKEYYIGDFGRGLHLVPRGLVEHALKESPKSEDQSVKS